VDIRKELENFPIVIYRQVQWGEMDAANHVNNVIYLRWSETARLEYFREMGIENSFSNSQGPILSFQDIKYLSSHISR